MKSISSLTYLSLASLFISSSTAWPLLSSFKHTGQKREPQAYSVVPVDGGSSTGASAAPTKTVTNVITQVHSSVVTSLSTIIITDSNISSTTVVPQTITVATTVVTTLDVAPTATASPSPATVSVPATPATVTVAPSVTSIPYDDGQWHTTYYRTSTLDGSGAASAAAIDPAPSSLSPDPTPAQSSTIDFAAVADSTPAATTSAAADPGLWQSWNTKGNNGQYTPS